VLAEPTTDRLLLRQALTYLQPDAGTAIGDGLQAGVRLVSSSLLANGVRREPGKRVPGAIVLMSDGFQTRGRLQPQRAADNARAAGIRVHTVALGTEHGVVQLGSGGLLNSLRVPPDPAEMRDIARRTGGQTFTARSAERLSIIYRSLSSSIGHHREPREITSWFAAAAALLLVAAIAAGRIVAGRLP
jgi:Ca-activated chloride channel family protein